MSQLSRVLEERDAEVRHRWVARVREHLASGHESPAELEDHIPLFLRQLQVVLRGGASREEASPEAGTSLLGREHGAQRFRLGFSLGALVREYGLLRDVLLDVIVEEQLEVPLAEVRLLTGFVDTAIAEAVEEHARQEEQARREAREAREAQDARLAAEKLQRQQDLRVFKSLVEASADYISIVDTQGGLLYINPAGWRLVGFSSLEQALAVPTSDMVDASFQATLRDVVVPMTRAGQSWEGEVPLRHAVTDERIPVFARTVPIRDEQGRVELLGTINRDGRETKRHEAERERLRLRAEGERERLNALFQQAPVAIGILRGPEFVVELINPLLLRLWGRTLEQVLGRPLLEALPEVRDQGIAELLSGVMRSGVAYVGNELPVHMPRGEGGELARGHYNFVYEPVHDAHGHADGVFIVAVDVTETVLSRQKMEALLQRSLQAEASRAALLDALSAQSLVAVGYLQGPEHINQTINASARQLAGREVMGLSFRDAFPELHQQGFTALLDRVRETGEPVVSRETLLRLAGTLEAPAHELVLDYTYQPVRTPGGDVEGILTLGLDVTQQVQLRRSAQGMAREERRLRDFEQHLIGIVSHDLRTPLSAILLGLQVLLRRVGLDARTQQSLVRLRSSAERALRMVRDLLDFTQARLGGGLKVERMPVDLHAVVRGVVEEFQETQPTRHLRLEQEGDGRGSYDGDRVDQLLGNLVGNALKYSPPGSAVTVRSAGEPEQVRLEVHNVGAPIPPDALPRLFQPLQRAVEGIDRATRSVGLGLYIVDQIARAHGGDVQVTSSETEGTRFTVRLPRAGTPPSPARGS